MKNTTKQWMFAAVASATLFSGVASADLVDYLEDAAIILPNKTDLAVFQEFRYDDNISNARKGKERGSFISKTGASVDVYRERDDFRWGVKGNASFDYYDHRAHDYNEFEWNITPYIKGSFRVFGDDTLSISLNSRNKRERYDTADTTYVRHMTNTASATYDMVVNSKWGIVFDANYKQDYYSQREFRNRSKQAYSFGVAPYVKVSDKTKVGVHGEYSETHYRNKDYANDSKTAAIGAFVNYRLTSKISMVAEVGGKKKDYEGLANRRGFNNKDEDFMPYYRMGVNYYMSNQFAVRLASKYGTEDTGAGRGLRDRWANTLALKWTPRDDFKVIQTLSYMLNDEKNYNCDSEEYKYTIEATYNINKHLSVYAGYEYDLVEYRYDGGKDFDDNLVYLGLRLAY